VLKTFYGEFRNSKLARASALLEISAENLLMIREIIYLKNLLGLLKLYGLNILLWRMSHAYILIITERQEKTSYQDLIK